MLVQGSPTPGGPQSVRNRAAQQEASGGQASERSFIPCSPSLAFPPEPSQRRPTPSVEELSSTEPIPGAKKGGDAVLVDSQTTTSYEWRVWERASLVSERPPVHVLRGCRRNHPRILMMDTTDGQCPTTCRGARARKPEAQEISRVVPSPLFSAAGPWNHLHRRPKSCLHHIFAL